MQFAMESSLEHCSLEEQRSAISFLVAEGVKHSAILSRIVRTFTSGLIGLKVTDEP